MAEIDFRSERCVGHALCNATSPEVYELDESGYLLAPPRMTLDPVLHAAAQAGADVCPEQAIAIVDDDVIVNS